MSIFEPSLFLAIFPYIFIGVFPAFGLVLVTKWVIQDRTERTGHSVKDGTRKGKSYTETETP